MKTLNIFAYSVFKAQDDLIQNVKQSGHFFQMFNNLLKQAWWPDRWKGLSVTLPRLKPRMRYSCSPDRNQAIFAPGKTVIRGVFGSFVNRFAL